MNDPTLLKYDKMGQVHWLVDGIFEACQKKYKCGNFITIDMKIYQSYFYITHYQPHAIWKCHPTF